MITVIVPHARPEFTENLLTNFRRQRGVDARMLVVANGPAAVVPFSMGPGVTVIRSPNHQSDAMNAGLDWLRSNGDGAWARFDDDDYYGPEYLSEVVDELRAHPVVGKTWGFVLFDDGLYRFYGLESGPAEGLTGGTHAANTAQVEPYRRMVGEDLQWCRDMQARGVAVWATSHRGYCYDRRSNRRGAPRIITTGPAATRWGFGASLFYGPLSMTAVDAPELRPLCARDRPTDAELMAELTTRD